MASVTFPENLGGDGSTVDDTASPTTGLKAGGHRARFIPALAQMVAVCAYTVANVSASIAQAAAYAASALNAPGTLATSATSLSLGLGNKTFTIQTGKLFSIGQTMVAASQANPNDQMIGVVVAHNNTTGSITLNVIAFAGTGSRADWTLSLTASSGVFSVAGLNGAVTAAALKDALNLTVADIDNYASDQAARETNLKNFAIAAAVAL